MFLKTAACVYGQVWTRPSLTEGINAIAKRSGANVVIMRIKLSPVHFQVLDSSLHTSVYE